MPDLHALISRMADELDHYRQLLTDDRREVHPLAAEARAVLAATDPIRANLERMTTMASDELDTTQAWAHSRPTWENVIAAARAALAAASSDGPAVPESREPASVVGEPSDEELLRIAAEAIDPYDKIGIGEYEAETECAVEAYGSELIAFARAVLSRWGRPAPAPAGERQAALVPVAVSVRPWEREGWCHPEERWAWFYNRRVGWRDAIPPESLKPPTLFPYTHSVPFHALPLPSLEVAA